MFELKSDPENAKQVERLIDKSRKAFEVAWMKVAEEVGDVLRSGLLLNLRRILIGWQPSEEAIDAFPFLIDVPSMLERYTRSFVIVSSEDGVSVIVDREKLRQQGLPPELSEILEFGTELTPPFPHFRAVVSSLDDEIARVGQRFQSEIMSEMSR